MTVINATEEFNDASRYENCSALPPQVSQSTDLSLAGICIPKYPDTLREN